MSQSVITHLPACFDGFPGAVLHLSPGGRVIESNGHLERELGKPVVGERFSEIIDAESCGEKWDRVLRRPLGHWTYEELGNDAADPPGGG